ncbi:MAG: hypothetical protein A2075_15565 [Geobacteraceae bacterium GWC2_58_44]|nr:MAG: hypothetical protein A2075_15565 [Geobacteraceae bacterium GWC2_58_44]
MSRACVILVNWNGWRDTLECLESLLDLDHPDFRVVVCDNGSADDSLRQISGWAKSRRPGFSEYRRGEAEAGGDPCCDHWLTLIDTGENLGFAGGNNVGLRYALARGGFGYFWLLNNDTAVEPDALTHLVERMRQAPAIGICGSTVKLYHDRQRTQALGGGYYCRWIGLPWHYGRFTRWEGAIDPKGRAESRMNYVEGASMLVSRRFLEEIGLLNEEYFLYFEEPDWAARAKGRFELGYAPKSVVYHKVGGSIGTRSNPAKKSLICDFYNIRNRILFARKCHPATLPTIYLALVPEILLRLLCGRWSRVGMILGLMLHGGERRPPGPGALRTRQAPSMSENTLHTMTHERMPAEQPRWRRYVTSLLAAELSTLTRYYDRVIQWLPTAEDSGLVLEQLDARHKEVVRHGEPFPDLSTEAAARTAVLLNGTINFHLDIQGLLMELKPRLSRSSRLLLIAYNPYLSWLYRLAKRLGIRKGELPSTFITKVDLENLAKLAGYQIVRSRTAAYFPWRLLGVGEVINKVAALLPGVRWSGLAYCAVLRPIVSVPAVRPSLSCIIPARNERGNIESALQRMPDLGCELEFIFVEGHSTDGTWEEIERVRDSYADRFSITAYRQAGVGKSDAVRLGFSKAKGELLTILDADLTMPPELLGRFYEAYCEGHADFINGSRLVYPMEGSAMRFLNILGNVFFAKTLSWVLDVRLGDTLCGTKLLSRSDYQRMTRWREDFGDFDPFGDFELLFPAAILGLGMVDVPIRYRDRTYGSTNISRFRHGLLLLRMTLIAFFRIKVGAGRALS